MKVKSESEAAQSRPHGLQPTRLLCPWDFPGKSTEVGCHYLLCKTQQITPKMVCEILPFNLLWVNGPHTPKRPHRGYYIE